MENAVLLSYNYNEGSVMSRDPQISFRMPKADAEDLRREAEEYDLTLSDYIRFILNSRTEIMRISDREPNGEPIDSKRGEANLSTRFDALEWRVESLEKQIEED